jgi:AraC-like DNA-binding protein
MSLGVVPFSASFAAGGPQQALWWLSFHERGRAELAAPGRLFALPPGRAVLIAPDIAGDAKAEGDAQHLLVRFELGRARSLIPALPVPEVPIVLEADPLRDELARALLGELAGIPAPSPGRHARAQALVHLCLSSVLDLAGHGARTADPGSDVRTQLMPVLRYVDAHLADLLPNSKLAELAHASESHFIRMFRRVFGHTPARHVQERRVATAADLLLRTSLSIDEIAERCGFANRYHFSRVFAQHMSDPPARFRALHANGSARAESDTDPYGSFVSEAPRN